MIKKVLDSIINYIKNGELAIFCGAGISYNSGIPLVDELEKCILNGCELKNEEILDILKYNMPFESFMESLNNLYRTENLFDVFNSSQPNANHTFIANLARLGLLRKVITTNFDTLFEQAFEKLGVPFLKYYQENEFQNIPQKSEVISLIKLHGCISDKKNMGITISRVSEQKLVSQRMKALSSVFNDNSIKALLVLGYSCSDYFDINPWIMNNKDKDIEILFVDHNKESEPSIIWPLSTEKNEIPFKNYKGYYLKVYTDSLITQLSTILCIKDRSKSLTYNDWRDVVYKWINEIMYKKGTNFLNYIAGTILFKTDNYPKAICYYSRYYNESIEKNHIAEGAFVLGKSYCEMGNFNNKSKRFLRIAIRISKKLNIPEVLSESLNSLGIVYWYMKKYKKSIKCYDEAFYISKNISDIDLQAKCIGNKAIVLKDMGGNKNLQESLKLHIQSLNLSQSIGDKKSEGRTLGNIGRTYSALGEKRKAIEFYQQALDIAIELSDLRHMGIWYENIGADYIGIDNELSQINLTKAIKIFTDIDISPYVERCLEYLKRIS